MPGPNWRSDDNRPASASIRNVVEAGRALERET